MHSYSGNVGHIQEHFRADKESIVDMLFVNVVQHGEQIKERLIILRWFSLRLILTDYL